MLKKKTIYIDTNFYVYENNFLLNLRGKYIVGTNEIVYSRDK